LGVWGAQTPKILGVQRVKELMDLATDLNINISSLTKRDDILKAVLMQLTLT
jgi:hypothetical protein